MLQLWCLMFGNYVVTLIFGFIKIFKAQAKIFDYNSLILFVCMYLRLM